MKNSDKNILNILSYFALAIIALLLVVEYILPLIGIQLQGTLLNILNSVKNLFILIVVGINGYAFTEGKAKWIKILFWVAIVVIIVCTVLMWL